MKKRLEVIKFNYPENKKVSNSRESSPAMSKKYTPLKKSASNDSARSPPSKTSRNEFRKSVDISPSNHKKKKKEDPPLKKGSMSVGTYEFQKVMEQSPFRKESRVSVP